MKKIAVAFLVLFASLLLFRPVFATQCTGLMKQIEAKIETVKVSDSNLEEVKALLEEGKGLHDQGRHEEAIEVLKEALALLEG